MVDSRKSNIGALLLRGGGGDKLGDADEELYRHAAYLTAAAPLLAEYGLQVPLGSSSGREHWLDSHMRQRLLTAPRHALLIACCDYDNYTGGDGRNGGCRGYDEAAERVGVQLQRCGFQVQLESNPHRERLLACLAAFCELVKRERSCHGCSTALVYFAGKGRVHSGGLQLCPCSGASVSTEDVVDLLMAAGAHTVPNPDGECCSNIFVFDCCRWSGPPLNEATRTVPPGSLVFATQHDAHQENGVHCFARCFCDVLCTSAERYHAAVFGDVAHLLRASAATGGVVGSERRQTWWVDRLNGPFVFLSTATSRESLGSIQKAADFVPSDVWSAAAATIIARRVAAAVPSARPAELAQTEVSQRHQTLQLYTARTGVLIDELQRWTLLPNRCAIPLTLRVCLADLCSRRFALLLSCARYERLPPLQCAHDDVTRLAAALRTADFTTVILRDPTSVEVMKAVLAFRNEMSRLDPCATSLVFFGGYGCVDSGGTGGNDQCVVPVDADVTEGISASPWVSGAKGGASVFVFDLCQTSSEGKWPNTAGTVVVASCSALNHAECCFGATARRLASMLESGSVGQPHTALLHRLRLVQQSGDGEKNISLSVVDNLTDGLVLRRTGTERRLASRMQEHYCPLPQGFRQNFTACFASIAPQKVHVGWSGPM
eukprot:TRINITY_DN2356_c0_g1_i5.p1 TRINITY_DN2356_c0_g1~~TRINITY_DN2356_c0_g1_i5.p1  ORF type:complete len:661 (+),score=121.89 TRINITY_DN2356_c0_g1_i5:827-2809(+)